MTYQGSPKSVVIVGGPNSKYIPFATTNAYQETVLPANIHSLTILNTHATDPIQWSYENATLEGELDGTTSITVNVSGKTSIYLKSTAGTATVRCWGW